MFSILNIRKYKKLAKGARDKKFSMDVRYKHHLFNFELSKNTLINIECYLGKLYIIRKTFYALIHLYVCM